MISIPSPARGEDFWAFACNGPFVKGRFCLRWTTVHTGWDITIWTTLVVNRFPRTQLNDDDAADGRWSDHHHHHHQEIEDETCSVGRERGSSSCADNSPISVSSAGLGCRSSRLVSAARHLPRIPSRPSHAPAHGQPRFGKDGVGLRARFLSTKHPAQVPWLSHNRHWSV